MTMRCRTTTTIAPKMLTARATPPMLMADMFSPAALCPVARRAAKAKTPVPMKAAGRIRKNHDSKRLSTRALARKDCFAVCDERRIVKLEPLCFLRVAWIYRVSACRLAA